MSWPRGPSSQNDAAPTSSFGGQNAFSSPQTDGQGNKSNRGVPLYIINIPLDINEEQLSEMFGKAGTVVHSKCLPPKEGRNSCVGFITYNTEEEAEGAISMFNNVQINRMTLRVDYTKTFKEGRSQKEDNAGSQSSSGHQSSFSSQSSPFSSQKSPFSSQSTNLHSIGRGVQNDNGSENQFSSIGRGIHTERPTAVPNGHVQDSFKQVTSQAVNNNFEEADWETPSSNISGPQEASHQNSIPQDMQASYPTAAQVPQSSGNNYYDNAPQYVQSPYPSQTQEPQSTVQGNYESVQQNTQSFSSVSEIPPSSTIQGYQTTQTEMNGLVNGFGNMQVAQPVNNQSFGSNQSFASNQPSGGSNQPSGGSNQPSGSNQSFGSNQPSGGSSQPFGSNQSFGSNQFQVSSRLPRSQDDSGERTCHKCNEAGHFAKECPNSSGGGGGGSGGCHKCGEQGHFARECPNGSHGDSGGGNCHQCGQPGHFARECPNKAERGQGGSCHRCGGQGHFARECPNNSTGNTGGGNCHQCGEPGHFARECPNKADRGQGGGCHKCGEQGHFARECPNSSAGGGGGGNCHQCGEPGHFARECPNKADRGQGGGCHKCGEQGHFARECPNSSAGGGGGGNCHQCGEPGHFARECPKKADGGQGGGGCHRCGEQGHFARECTNSGEDQEGVIRPPRVDYIPPPLPEDVDLLFKAAVHKGINFDRFDNIPVEVTGNNPPASIQTFDELVLPDTLRSNLGKAEFTKPTPVQKHGIPIILNGRDIMACAQTGSGKTVAFLLPVMVGMVNSRLPEASYMGGDAASPAALCIAPTRELAFQIYTEALKFSSGTYLRPVVCYGGVSVQHQLQKLERGCHILIGTPGRLLDFVGRNKVSLTNVRYLILDEADRMLDMGFEQDVRKIITQFGMPESTQRQTLMFSATFPDEIQKLAAEFLNDYFFVAVGSVGGSNLDIKQEIMDLQNDQKRNKLLEILGESGTNKTLVFVERKRNADFLASWLSQNRYPATSISGDRSQMEREEALRDFRNGRASILVATSVAARGLDIPDVKHVINYDLPQQIEEYVHRIGRTGRIGNQGQATAFFERGKDDKLARSLVKVLSDALQDVPNWLEEVAEHALGTSYGPAGGKFASRDTRQYGSRRSGGGGGDSNSQSSPSSNVSLTNQSMAHTQGNVGNGGDEENWD